MKFKNKILIITLIFVAIILLNNLDCFGYSAGDTVTISPLEGDPFEITLQNDLPEEYSNFNYFCLSKNNYISIIPNSVAYLKIDTPSNDYVIGRFYDVSGNFVSKKELLLSSDGFFNPRGSNPTNSLVILKSCFTDTDSAILSKHLKYTIYNSDDTVFFKVTPTLEETLVEGYKVAKTTIHQTTKQQLVEILPVGVVIMATLILVSLIAYFRFWRQ